MTTEQKKISYLDLLKEALTEEGKISKAYTAFRNYSFGNVLLAMQQLDARELPIEPIATYKQWSKLGAKVKKGSKAISLLVPNTVQRKAKEQEEEEDAGMITFFNLRAAWFSASQTDATEKAKEELKKDLVGGWQLESALKELEIKLVDFEIMEGNVLGYASGREIAINPVNPHKHKTIFHEIAHVICGHTKQAAMNDAPELSRNIAELEAESVAYLCVSALELDGREESRGYIQSWFKEKDYPEQSAKKVINAAEKILKAGKIKTS